MSARDAGQPASPDVLAPPRGPSGRLRRHLGALRDLAGASVPGGQAVQAHLDRAVAELDTLEALAREALRAVRDRSAESAAEAARFEAEIAAERDALEAALASRQVAEARFEEALRARDAVIQALHGDVVEAHVEALALERARDAARAELLALTEYYEAAMQRRDEVIRDMHGELAELHLEAMTLSGERSAALARAEAAEGWNEESDERGALRAEADAARREARALAEALTQATGELRRASQDLALAEAERDTYRTRLREAVEAARAGRLGEFGSGGRFATVRAERVGTRRQVRATAELTRRGPPTGSFPRVERGEVAVLSAWDKPER